MDASLEITQGTTFHGSYAVATRASVRRGWRAVIFAALLLLYPRFAPHIAVAAAIVVPLVVVAPLVLYVVRVAPVALTFMDGTVTVQKHWRTWTFSAGPDLQSLETGLLTRSPSAPTPSLLCIGQGQKAVAVPLTGFTEGQLAAVRAHLAGLPGDHARVDGTGLNLAADAPPELRHLLPWWWRHVVAWQLGTVAAALATVGTVALLWGGD